MSTIDKKHVKIITTAIKNQSREIKATARWLNLVAEFSIGRVHGNKIHFTRDDLKKWRDVLISSCGYDPIETTLTGNRTETTRTTHQDKWAPESELTKQLSTTVIGGDFVTTKGRCCVIPEVDYRVNKALLNVGDYDACLVVENFEAFLFIHQFNLPNLGHVLVLYRGHDKTARAVIEFLESVTEIPVIGFTDPDPSGLGILNDWPWLSHVLIPDVSLLSEAPSLHDRFQKQLKVRPSIKAECEGKSESYQRYANWIVDTGFAGTQEWLCGHRIPLELIFLNY